MTAHPILVGGEETLDSDIMALSEGRIVAKLGAEGLLCLAVPERGLGIAISAEDGSSRALGPAAVAVIEQLELAEPATWTRCESGIVETVKTFGGEAVGEMRPAFISTSAKRFGIALVLSRGVACIEVVMKSSSPYSTGRQVPHAALPAPDRS